MRFGAREAKRPSFRATSRISKRSTGLAPLSSNAGQARYFYRQCRRARAADASRSCRTGPMDTVWRSIHRQLAADPVARPFASRRRGGACGVRFIGRRTCRPSQTYWGPYAVTKAALDALARTYAAETMNISRVRVMTVDPGRCGQKCGRRPCPAKTR